VERRALVALVDSQQKQYRDRDAEQDRIEKIALQGLDCGRKRHRKALAGIESVVGFSLSEVFG
jgi:hypothetical protein